MYINSAYLFKQHGGVEILDKPLFVTCAGYYRMQTRKLLRTDRPQGRKDYQLLYVAAGKVRFYFDGVERIVTKGSMVLFRPNEPQTYDLSSADKSETYWVHFTGGAVEEMLQRYEIPSNEPVIFAGSSPDYPWLFRRLIQELQLQRANFEELLAIELQHIFLLISRYQQEEHRIAAQMLDEIARAEHYFSENYHKNIVIEDYAKSCLMSANWFTQNFRRITKLTPMQYIVSLRITNAMSLLDQTDYTVAQIAEAVGYDNALYFSRIFKKHTGMSPSAYKNRHT